ncbi:hypothetical protein FQA47_006381 [Oryzias melastigma]|uniref:Uncharacterized protein n=1 Tax=Oryzias melastigma TaxID=30732 RepID=A0A834CFZ1_ORYME|nr:hypothetical protein FQA47_006381 [Oryzias melastigma]
MCEDILFVITFTVMDDGVTPTDSVLPSSSHARMGLNAASVFQVLEDAPACSCSRVSRSPAASTPPCFLLFHTNSRERAEGLSVILGQPFPWNVAPAAKEKSLQRNAHTTLQDDLKRPESWSQCSSQHPQSQQKT